MIRIGTRKAFVLFAALTMLQSTSMATLIAAPPTAKFKGNGSYIQVYGSAANGCVWFYLYAGKSGTASAPTTYLYYDMYDSCSGQWSAYGGGQIANSALTVTKKGATLKMTPVDSSSFSVEGASGDVKLTLTADGVYSHRYSGHSRTEYSGHVYQHHGAWTSASAAVSGSFLGFALDHVYANFGEGRDKYMEFDRGN
jgi:hypothetical protein